MNWIKLTSIEGRGINNRKESIMWYDSSRFYSLGRCSFVIEASDNNKLKEDIRWEATVIWSDGGRFQHDVKETPEEVLAMMREGKGRLDG
jgi:hypothetical protein